MELLEGLHTRRSIRSYTGETVSREQLHDILRAGTMAPSGLNNQPWRFVTIQSKDLLSKLSKLTKYSHIIANAPACIVVFIDTQAMYHETKDHQSMGACIQNILLAAHGMGLGAVWLGEILKSAREVRELCGLREQYDLMAVVALGRPAGKGGRADRKPLEEVLIKEL
jgi:nitroreductase